MEDAQPNEFRLARKGSTAVPRVRASWPVRRRQSHTRAHPSPLDSIPSKRKRWQPSPARPPPPNDRAEDTVGHELVTVDTHLPKECHKGQPGWRNARKRWIENQKHYLRTSRHYSVASFKYLDNQTRVQFACRTRQVTQSTRRYSKDSIETTPHLANAHSGLESTSDAQQGEIVSSVVKADNHRGSGQSREPGPSDIRPASWPPIGFGNWAAADTVPAAEMIVDWEGFDSLNPPSPIVEKRSTRWSTFRSGYVNILFPSLDSDSRTSTDPGPSISKAPAPVVRQLGDMPIDHRGNDHLHSTRSNAPTVEAVPIDPTDDYRTNIDSFPDQPRQHEPFEAARSTYPHNHSILLDGMERALPSPPDSNPPQRGLPSTCSVLPLLLGPHDRPRRLLYGDDFAYVVTAHGIIDRISATNALKLDRNIQSPSLPLQEFVDDACMHFHQEQVVIILGHAREQNQISILSLEHGQVGRHITLHRAWNKMKRFGVSAMTFLMSPLRFASGGYDHRVHIWDIAHDLSSASATELAIKHTSAVHSLLPILDTSHKLMSVGADRDVPIYDLSAERTVQTLKVSCMPYHAHKTNSTSCTLLEVSHLETQFEVRDHRIPNRASERFGFISEERRGRYDKAGTWSHFAACGDKNGAVHLWDLRNVSKEVVIRQCFNDPVVHVVNTGSRWLACSKKNELGYVDFEGG